MRLLLCLLCLFVVSCEGSVGPTPRSEAAYNISQIMSVKLNGNKVIIVDRWYLSYKPDAEGKKGIWYYRCRAYNNEIIGLYEFELE